MKISKLKLILDWKAAQINQTSKNNNLNKMWEKKIEGQEPRGKCERNEPISEKLT